VRVPWLSRPRYRGTPPARLWRPFTRLAVAFVLASAAGGCSYQLDSLWTKGDLEATGSLRAAAPKQALTKQASTLPPENDLVVARAAITELMTKGGKDTSMPWENPRTGARGTITPIATAYSQDGLTCRDFLASYVREGAESWLQGEACRAHQGRWEVRNLRSWQERRPG
jgi:17 kDa outer membrane surface antigen